MKSIVASVVVILIAVALNLAKVTPTIAQPPFEPDNGCPDPNVRKPQTISLGRIDSRVIDIPKPVYPIEAKDAKILGVVTALVVVDETGKVIWARVPKWSCGVAGGCQNSCVSGSLEAVQGGGRLC